MVHLWCGDGMFSSVEAVLFDKDGTLADSQQFLWHLGNQRIAPIAKAFPELKDWLLNSFGILSDRIDPAGLLAVGTRYENEIAVAAAIATTGCSWVNALVMTRDAFVDADRCLGRKADRTPLFAGGKAVLQRLKSAGLKTGILSADSSENVCDFARRYHLDPVLDLLQGTDGTLGKPDPQFFWQACEELNVEPDRVLMVGDSQADIAMAQAAGAGGSVAVTWGWTDRSDLAGATTTINHFDQIHIESP